MKLVIAEKPSVGQAIAAVLGAEERSEGYLQGSGYIVSWCIGHLVELAPADAYGEAYSRWRYEDLPILPGPWQYRVPSDKQKQFNILKKLIHDPAVDEVICATDAGREGELIFRLVYGQAGAPKPVHRLWIRSLEDRAIREGFSNLRDSSEYDALYASALCRAKADWLVGINGTRLFSVLYRQTLNIGRVMTPTLALVVDRWSAIQGFRAEPFYTVALQFDRFEASGQRLKDRCDAEAIVAFCNRQPAKVLEAVSHLRTEHPPKLCDLTTLQREANRLLSFTAQQTLDYAQNLYEKKLITYPRTDSRYLPSDMADTAVQALESTTAALPFMKPSNTPHTISQLICDSKVSDHHAIIPTTQVSEARLRDLPQGERELLVHLMVRLLSSAGEPHRYTETVVTLECGEHRFTSKGKSVQQAGWKATEDEYRQHLRSDPEEDPPQPQLPLLQAGQLLKSVQVNLREGKTTPPKPFTEDTLLSAMESAGVEDLPEDAERRGLGTPATRAGILEKLIRTGLMERKGSKKAKTLQPTHKGIALITVVPERIRSPQMTAQWEEQLQLIAQGSQEPADFMADITRVVRELVSSYRAVSAQGSELPHHPDPVGPCPRCGASVVEGQRRFFCSSESCGFALWKESYFLKEKKKALTRAMAVSLLKSGSVPVKGLFSPKTGKTFDAKLQLEDTGSTIRYRLVFPENGSTSLQKSQSKTERKNAP